MDNATRRELLELTKQAQSQGAEFSVLDVYRNPDLVGEFAQTNQPSVRVAQTPQDYTQGLRGAPTGTSMVFPDVQPNVPFNTVGMREPINIKKFDTQGHLVKSYENVPPGIKNLPMGPKKGTVIETPARKQGGGPEPTRADSLALYNNALDKIRFYQGNKDYSRWDTGTDFMSRDNRINLINLAQGYQSPITEEHIEEVISRYENSGQPLTPEEIQKLRSTLGEIRFGNVPGTNLTSFGDILDDEPDDWYNPLAPPIYLHPNISPQGDEAYLSGIVSDLSDIPYYDPLAIAPIDQLTPEQIKERVDKYGNSGVPVRYQDPNKPGYSGQSSKSSPTTAQSSSVTTPYPTTGGGSLNRTITTMPPASITTTPQSSSVTTTPPSRPRIAIEPMQPITPANYSTEPSSLNVNLNRRETDRLIDTQDIYRTPFVNKNNVRRDEKSLYQVGERRVYERPDGTRYTAVDRFDREMIRDLKKLRNPKRRKGRKASFQGGNAKDPYDQVGQQFRDAQQQMSEYLQTLEGLKYGFPTGNQPTVNYYSGVNYKDFKGTAEEYEEYQRKAGAMPMPEATVRGERVPKSKLTTREQIGRELFDIAGGDPSTPAFNRAVQRYGQDVRQLGQAHTLFEFTGLPAIHRTDQRLKADPLRLFGDVGKTIADLTVGAMTLGVYTPFGFEGGEATLDVASSLPFVAQTLRGSRAAVNLVKGSNYTYKPLTTIRTNLPQLPGTAGRVQTGYRQFGRPTKLLDEQLDYGKIRNEVRAMGAEHDELVNINTLYRDRLGDAAKETMSRYGDMRLEYPKYTRTPVPALESKYARLIGEEESALSRLRDMQSRMPSSGSLAGYTVQSPGVIKHTGRPSLNLGFNPAGGLFDYTTGQYVPNLGQVGYGDQTVTYTLKDGKVVADTKGSDIYTPNPKLTEVAKSNIATVEADIPGAKVFGSQRLAALDSPHIPRDADVIMAPDDYAAFAKNNPAVSSIKFGHTHDYKGQKTDIVVLEETEGMASGKIAEELFRQVDPEAYFTAVRTSVEKGEDLKIPYTAKDLLAQVDPDIKTVVDNLSATKPDKILRTDGMIQYANPEVVAKGQLQWAKGLVGEKATVGPQFGADAFSDVNANMKVLEDIGFLGDPKAVAQDPQRMQLAMNQFYLDNTLITRSVGGSSLEVVEDAVTTYLPSAGGGAVQGIGQNWMKLENLSSYRARNSGVGESAVQGIGIRQVKIESAATNPQQFVDDFYKQTAGDVAFTPEESAKVNEIVAKHNLQGEFGPYGADSMESLITRLPYSEEGAAALYEVGEAINRRVTTAPGQNTTIWNEYPMEFVASTTKSTPADEASQIMVGDKKVEGSVQRVDDFGKDIKSYQRRASAAETDKAIANRDPQTLETARDLHKLEQYLTGGVDRLKLRTEAVRSDIARIQEQKLALEKTYTRLAAEGKINFSVEIPVDRAPDGAGNLSYNFKTVTAPELQALIDQNTARINQLTAEADALEKTGAEYILYKQNIRKLQEQLIKGGIVTGATAVGVGVGTGLIESKSGKRGKKVEEQPEKQEDEKRQSGGYRSLPKY